ncbi:MULTISPECIES: EamA family transporter [unclassified Coleofasciculus]|uniref:EamA family transporter n=1 Tax=unclassified Coleofasciculus TaxID=2692782 RepID=UPI00187F7822|nr:MULTISPECIES: DMT family transporter [unclassified Coleofasciculus]MBE9128969.1 DMT family transporter [Coleofasciculus sp. LEGE 07081]MBE9151693.1 DMT family transporter [Coleofasciculus sp. LEGE 07092]
MGQSDKQPENFESGDLRTVEDLLSAMTESIEGIETLRHSLVIQFSQDIERLRQEKVELLEDVETLKLQRQEQMTQQQQTVLQIAPTLVNQLHELLTQHFNQLAESQGETGADSAIGDRTETIYQRMASLDATLRSTFQALQQDLSSYQSSISQQLSQMHSLEQQGEAILETLVNRLKAEIPPESTTLHNFSEASPRPPLLPPDDESPENQNGRVMITYPTKQSLPDTVSAPEPKPPMTLSQPQTVRKRFIGLLLVLLSLLALAFENVLVHIIFNSSPLTGVSAPIGGFIVPTVGNTLLILWLRMLVIVPLMAIFATGFYPFMWRDIQQFLRSQDWGLFANLVGSGFLLFLSKVLIFLALGSIAPGVAVTVFFIYPIVLLLLGDRFNRFSSFLIFSSVMVGFVLATLPTGGSGELSRVGVTVAAASGITFALHLLLMQLSAKKLHPIPILWLNLAIVLIVSAFSLVIPLPPSWSFEVEPSLWSSVIISGLMLGGVTLLSYVFNYLGIARLGAASASVLGATLPALTALVALILVQSTMQLWQILGMVFVTVGVAALGFERSRHPSQKKRSG